MTKQKAREVRGVGHFLIKTFSFENLFWVFWKWIISLLGRCGHGFAKYLAFQIKSNFKFASKELCSDHKSYFPFPIFLQPDSVSLLILKTLTIGPNIIHSLNIKGLRHQVAIIKESENFCLW